MARACELEVLPGHVRNGVVDCEAILPALMITLVIACGDSPREIPSPPPRPSPLEQTVASQLSAKLGRPARVTCTGARCRANVGDAVLPIVIKNGTWTVDGLLVRSEPIERYFEEALSDLGTPQRARCGPAIRSVAPGARIECVLERGGKAFAVIAADGSFTPEIDLDPAAAAARSTEEALPLIDRRAGSGSDRGSDDDDD